MSSGHCPTTCAVFGDRVNSYQSRNMLGFLVGEFPRHRSGTFLPMSRTLSAQGNGAREACGAVLSINEATPMTLVLKGCSASTPVFCSTWGGLLGAAVVVVLVYLVPPWVMTLTFQLDVRYGRGKVLWNTWNPDALGDIHYVVSQGSWRIQRCSHTVRNAGRHDIAPGDAMI